MGVGVGVFCVGGGVDWMCLVGLTVISVRYPTVHMMIMMIYTTILEHLTGLVMWLSRGLLSLNMLVCSCLLFDNLDDY